MNPRSQWPLLRKMSSMQQDIQDLFEYTYGGNIKSETKFQEMVRKKYFARREANLKLQKKRASL